VRTAWEATGCIPGGVGVISNDTVRRIWPTDVEDRGEHGVRRGCLQQAVEVDRMHIGLMSDEEGSTAGHRIGPRFACRPRGRGAGDASGGDNR
jgi:hypothetical protein